MVARGEGDPLQRSVLVPGRSHHGGVFGTVMEPLLQLGFQPLDVGSELRGWLLFPQRPEGAEEENE
jgi:hypothetical protein